MDRGAWWAIVHGVARVGHDLATKERERETEMHEDPLEHERLSIVGFFFFFNKIYPRKPSRRK